MIGGEKKRLEATVALAQDGICASCPGKSSLAIVWNAYGAHCCLCDKCRSALSRIGYDYTVFCRAAYYLRHGAEDAKRIMEGGVDAPKLVYHGQASRMTAKYKISYRHLINMLTAQDGKCAICLQPPPDEADGDLGILDIDHCHITGAVRGLLCSLCNTGLGFMIENPDVADAIARFLGSGPNSS